MFDEFGSLYTNADDPRFTGLIDAGKYSELEGLPSFQKQISESVGYRKYCSSVMKSSYSVFFQAQTNNAGDDLSDEDAKIPKI
jgi:carbonic anhydrase